MKTYILTLCMLSAFGLHAQVILEKAYGSKNGDCQDPRDMISANDGGYFVAGGGKDANNDKAMFLLKLNEDLDSTWVKHYQDGRFLDMRGDHLLYNSNGNLCVIGTTFGPGVMISLWELNQDGDTIKTRHNRVGSSGIDFVVTDVVARPDGGYIVLFRNNSTSGTMYSFDEDLEIQWSDQILSALWNISPNAQFTGVELKDTILYAAARKVNGAGHNSYLIKAGLSGTFLGVDTFGTHGNGLRFEDVALTDNEELLFTGTITTEIMPMVTSARTMVYKTNLDGDSLGISIDLNQHFPVNIDLINGSAVVNGEGFPKPSSINHKSTASVAYFDEGGFFLNSFDHILYNVDTILTPSHKAIRTIGSGGDFITMGSRSDDGHVYLVKYTPDLLGIDDMSNNHSSLDLFPNPAYSWIKLPISDASSRDLQVFDLQGRKCIVSTTITSGHVEMNVAGLESGVYVVVDAESGKSARFIKI